MAHATGTLVQRNHTSMIYWRVQDDHRVMNSGTARQEYDSLDTQVFIGNLEGARYELHV